MLMQVGKMTFKSPQESISDMDNALNHGYPSHLLHKLEQRRAQCLKHLSLGVSANKEHLKPLEKGSQPDSDGNLTFGPLGICPQAAVGFNPERGRHLVATEGIAAGDVILSDRPYSCVLIPGMKEVRGKGAEQDTDGGVLFGMEHRLCHRCLSPTLCPLPCDGCSYSRYCSALCQQEAWEEHHRWECPLGAELMAMGVMSQLALRVAFKAGRENIQAARELLRKEHANPKSSNPPSFQTSRPGASYLSVFHLLHHLKRHSPTLRFLCAVTVATLCLKLSVVVPSLASRDPSEPLGGHRDSPVPGGKGGVGDGDLWILGGAALRHLLQLRCNAQAVVMLQDTGNAHFRGTAVILYIGLLETSLVCSVVVGMTCVFSPYAFDRKCEISGGGQPGGPHRHGAVPHPQSSQSFLLSQHQPDVLHQCSSSRFTSASRGCVIREKVIL